jgi:putative transposase
VPEKITIDKSGANTATIESVRADACVDIVMRQNKYPNYIVEQDHRAIKRITRPMLESARKRQRAGSPHKPEIQSNE